MESVRSDVKNHCKVLALSWRKILAAESKKHAWRLGFSMHSCGHGKRAWVAEQQPTKTRALTSGSTLHL